MDNIALLVAIGLFFWVFFYRKISPLSLYTLFGLQWFFYLFFPYLQINNLLPEGLPRGWALNDNKEVLFYFFIFNAIFLIIFSSMYWIFYRTKPTAGPKAPRNKEAVRPYRGLLFVLLSLASIFLIVLSVKFPYLKYNWIAHSINANVRNIFVALFFYYMLLENKRWRVYFIFFLFALSTLLGGAGCIWLL